MSIVPNKANGSSASPNPSDLAPPPLSKHGGRSPHPSRRRGALHSGGRADPDPAASSAGISDSTVNPSTSSSKEVHNVFELRAPDSRKCSNGQENGANIQDETTSIGGTSSQSGSIHYNLNDANVMNSTGSVHQQQFTMRPKGSHGNITRANARKNQLVNANHLLNFYYDPIQRSQPRLPPLKRQQNIRPFNRDLFLQANYKFVIFDTGNYVVESIDPDKMLQWDDVVCVRFSTPSIVQCPICLENPLCPQITSCGHIYCFPCILRYLIGEEDHKYCKKCPLCFMMITVKDLYTIQIDHVKQPDVGDHAYFTLMTRPKDSFVPTQVDEVTSDLATAENDQYNSFSKIILTSDVELSVREAKSHLNEWLAKAESSLVDDLEKLPYVCAALEQLELRAKGFAELRAKGFAELRAKGFAEQQAASILTSRSFIKKNTSQAPTEKLPQESSLKVNSGESPVIKACSSGSERNSLPGVFNVDKPSLTSHSNDRGKMPSDESKDAGDKDAYMFYQVIDGQHRILHPLNMKCLLYHYKSSDLLPSRISGKILQLESVTQSEASRRRYRFLSHFPLTTSFQLCEIDLREMLPVDAFSPFLDEIKKRDKQRKLAARKERKSTERSKAVVSCASSPIHSFREAHVKDDVFELNEFEALGNPIIPSSSTPITGERKKFSDVTKLGFAAAHDSPSIGVVGPSDHSSGVESRSISNTGPSTSVISFANILSAKPVACLDAPEVSISEKKGKKATRVLLSTAGGRRY